MLSDIKQDFDAALIKHLLFKSKLRSYLYGQETNEVPLRDPRQCSLGQWIAQRALGPYRHLPESRELAAVHEQIHRVANRLMDLHQQGQTEEALAGLSQVQPLADQITTLLQTMQAKLQTS